MRHPIAALCLALAAALPGCTTLDPVTAARLSRLDPLTADPAALVARLHLPEGLAVAPGGAVLRLSARREDTGEALDEAYVLERRGAAWRLSAVDAAALRSVQHRIAGWKAEAPEASGGALSLSLTGCATGAGPNPKGEVAADLSLDGGTRFMPLLRGLTVAEITRAAGPGATLGPCR
ncbi:hypothetical protein [Vannielia litorea]|uniref:Uncharacterized protein n=1 Tax=Vannielia litorea TaxID=1217970 RepID=A0A1N6H681_9RHOB|nr:hypothetical protein [Vannielia litorea]SIO15318.1 hypothetical protein SAMN05444002_3116 [Vannielia litorea]